MPVSTLYQPTVSSAARAVPIKSTYPLPLAQPIAHGRMPGISPPSAGSSVNSSAVPSLTSGSTGGDYESPAGGPHGVDLMDMMADRLGSAVDPLPMDRSLARQAQTSGELNAKQRELAELQALAQRRLRGTRANIAEGMKAAKEVRRDLEWTQKRVSALNEKAARKYPSAYKSASQRRPAAVEN